MTKSISALLNDLIDYAGMFPPAKLPFAEAFQNYLSYRKSKRCDFLARFILPMDTFAPFCDAMTASPQTQQPVRISALGGEQTKELNTVEEFATELTYLKDLLGSHPADLKIESYEARLSVPMMVALASDPHRDDASPQLSAFGDGVVAALTHRDNDGLRCFFEVPFNGFTVASTAFELTIDELARINNQLMKEHSYSRVGVKLRCGGERIPASYMVAEILVRCMAKSVPFKATQGLHHPFFSSSRDEKHGFISLFAATVLVAANQMSSAERVAEIVSDGKPEHFKFTDNELVWDGKYHASVEQIVTARQDLFFGFGSCNFEEPLSDLQQLKLI